MTTAFIEAPVYGERILSQQPTGRVGDPEELIGPLLFLASDVSSYVNSTPLSLTAGVRVRGTSPLRRVPLRVPRRDRPGWPRGANMPVAAVRR